LEKIINYGSEWNLSVSRKFGAFVYTKKYAMSDNGDWIQKVGIKSLAPDATKFWLQAGWNF
jgi:hypothetical protein